MREKIQFVPNSSDSLYPDDSLLQTNALNSSKQSAGFRGLFLDSVVCITMNVFKIKVVLSSQP